MVSITLQMYYFQIVCELRQLHSTEDCESETNGIYLVHFSKQIATTKMTPNAKLFIISRDARPALRKAPPGPAQ